VAFTMTTVVLSWAFGPPATAAPPFVSSCDTAVPSIDRWCAHSGAGERDFVDVGEIPEFAVDVKL
jgi:hypothetical protein